MDVLGENEALQQFFYGQDVSEVVDTSLLEQYLSNDYHHSIMLPESPPDSGSEPCSPPQMTDVHAVTSSWSPEQLREKALHLATARSAAVSCRLTEQPLQVPYSAPPPPRCHPVHPQLHPHLSNVQVSAHPATRAHEPPIHPQYLSPADSYIQAQTSPLAPGREALQQPQCLGPQGVYPRTNAPSAPSTSPCLVQSPAGPEPDYQFLQHTSGHQPGPALTDSKKRRRSESFEAAADNGLWGVSVWTKAPYMGADGGGCEMSTYDSDTAGGGSVQGAYPLLAWDQHQADQWRTLYNDRYENLPPPGYHVDTDKGFNYSSADEAFVCQKKNHFQVTVHVRMEGDPKFVKTPKGPAPIDSFYVNVFGMKLEAHSNLITIEQSQSDRSKKPFLPVNVNLPGDKITKVTLGRLHFSETTTNNMRKKGKPNPDQRYFLMVVGLYASVKGESHLVVAHMSERIIVRASNPGQFENDSEVHWQRGQTPDSVVCQGRVGINTETPDEALVVCGNAKIMGSVMHPSDRRAKQNIQEVNSIEHLKRISQMRIVEYDYKPEFAEKMGIKHVHETGVIAQEVQEVLPNAVKEVGDITCTDGKEIKNFLMVDKEQIFMENVGAVKQLCKLTDDLETRIQELEVWNNRLTKVTTSVPTTAAGPKGKVDKIHTVPPPPRKRSPLASVKYFGEKYKHCCHHRAFQTGILTVVAVLAFCVISITAIYMLTLNEDFDFGNNVLPIEPNTTFPITGPSTDPSQPWPPEVVFCFLLECDQVYCCPSDPGESHTRTNSAITVEPYTNSQPSGQFNDERQGGNYRRTSTRNSAEWTNATIQSIIVMPSQQVIDQRYCLEGMCEPGNYSYAIPISKFVPVDMNITLQMNSTEPLVVHKCHADETNHCASAMASGDEEEYLNSTQGYLHEWVLPVARLHQSSYHLRAAKAGLADCSTDPSHMGASFTDYHLHFYRRCD
ncbi:myelin regulatory factor-like protein isoform X2 [Clupea harengus]|uniref:Myelin regulatory factor-like protein isoform X2 n=1 Tax=Clupea harengus TaxID=7950 RepID=A0A6P8GT13_CLUHA|nr:myelin regulatory factor-like protein isoform X2 [Clupea harengus]